MTQHQAQTQTQSNIDVSSTATSTASDNPINLSLQQEYQELVSSALSELQSHQDQRMETAESRMQSALDETERLMKSLLVIYQNNVTSILKNGQPKKKEDTVSTAVRFPPSQEQQQRRQTRKMLAHKRFHRGHMRQLETHLSEQALAILSSLAQVEAAALQLVKNDVHDEPSQKQTSLWIQMRQRLDRLVFPLEKELLLLGVGQDEEDPIRQSLSFRVKGTLETILYFGKLLSRKFAQDSFDLNNNVGGDGLASSIPTPDDGTAKDITYAEVKDVHEDSVLASILKDNNEDWSSFVKNHVNYDAPVGKATPKEQDSNEISQQSLVISQHIETSKLAEKVNDSINTTILPSTAPAAVATESEVPSPSNLSPKATSPTPPSQQIEGEPKMKPSQRSIWSKLGIPSKRAVPKRSKPTTTYDFSVQSSSSPIRLHYDEPCSYQQNNGKMNQKKQKQQTKKPLVFWSGLIQDLHTAPTIVVPTPKTASAKGASSKALRPNDDN